VDIYNPNPIYTITKDDLKNKSPYDWYTEVIKDKNRYQYLLVMSIDAGKTWIAIS